MWSLYFKETSSPLPLPSRASQAPALAPGVCCLCAAPLSCLPVSTTISHYLAQFHPAVGRAGSRRDSPLCSPSSSFSRDKSKNSLLTDLPFPSAPWFHFPLIFFTASTFPPQGPEPSLPPACLPGPPPPKAACSPYPFWGQPDPR